MTTKKTNTRNTPPRIKWGSLIFAIATIPAELILIGLNWYANTGAMADADPAFGFIAAYGWILGAIILMGGFAEFFEEFLPSFRSYQKWEKKEAALKAQRQAETESYEELLAIWG